MFQKLELYFNEKNNVILHIHLAELIIPFFLHLKNLKLNKKNLPKLIKFTPDTVKRNFLH